MSIFIVAVTLIFISIVGYAIIRGLHFLSAKDTLLAIGTSYGLGVGLMTMQLYLYSRMNIPWSRELLLFPWILLIILLVIKNRRKVRVRFLSMPRLGRIEYLLLFGIFMTVSYTIFEALIRPVTHWDAWANWLFQAKAFFTEGGIRPESLVYMNSEYPLTINLLGAYVYIMLGYIDDTAVLLTSTAFYLFLTITFFAVLNKRFGLKYALLFAFLLAATQNFIRHGGRMEAGLADLPLGYFAFISVVLLFEYFKNNSGKLFVLVNIFLAITALIKFEGIPLTGFIAFCAIVYIHRKKLYKHIPIMLLWILPYLLWQGDRKLMNLQNLYFSEGHPHEMSIKKSTNAFYGTFKELINIKSWNVLWISYFYSLFFMKVKNMELLVLNFVILSQLSVYLIIYNITVGNNPESSIERLLMHIAPMAFFAVAIMLHREVKKRKWFNF